MEPWIELGLAHEFPASIFTFWDLRPGLTVEGFSFRDWGYSPP